MSNPRIDLPTRLIPLDPAQKLEKTRVDVQTKFVPLMHLKLAKLRADNRQFSASFACGVLARVAWAAFSAVAKIILYVALLGILGLRVV